MKKINFYLITIILFIFIGILQVGCKKEESTPDNQFPKTLEEIQQSIESIAIINTQAEQIIEQKINTAFTNDDVIIPLQIANEISSIENVISATPSLTGTSINIKQKDGVTFNVLLINPSDERIFKETNKPQKSLQLDNGLIGNSEKNTKSFPNGTGKALIIAPFEDEFHTDIANIKEKLSASGFTNHTYYKQDNLDIFRGDFLREFDVIIFSTHGGAFVENRTGVSSTSLCTGVQATPNNLLALTEEEQNAIGFMMIPGDSKLYYGLNVPWLELTTTGDFTNTWIYANSCESSKIDEGPESLSEAFFNLGVGGYNGYNEIIFTVLAEKILNKMIDNFRSGLSLEVSANETRNDTELKMFAWLVRLLRNPDLYATVDLLDNHQREMEPYYLLEPNNESKNVALSVNGATASAISEGTYNGDTQYAYEAIDGNKDIGWSSSFDMPAWLNVEFDQVYSIDSIGVWWGSHKHDYSISLSLDGSNWTTVKTGISNNSEGSAPVYELFSINSTNAKYMKIDITSTSAPSSHIFQASVNEIEAYGKLK